METVELMMTPEEVAGIAHIKVETLRKWRCTKEVALPYVKFGGRVLYKVRDVNRFIHDNTTGQ